MSKNTPMVTETAKAQSESATTSNGSASATFNTSQAINLCATGLLICFFLPWAQLLGKSVSGFDLQKLGGSFTFLWLIPISCGIAVIASYLKQGQKIAAQFAGMLPFLALFNGIHEFGVDVVKNILATGAYAGLALAVALTILSKKAK